MTPARSRSKSAGEGARPTHSKNQRMSDNFVAIASAAREFRGGRRRAGTGPAPPASAATSVSIPAAAPSTPPTDPTIARSPSAWFFPATPMTSSPQSRWRASTALPPLPRQRAPRLAGQCCNVALVLDFTRYMGNILEIDPQTAHGPGAARSGARPPAQRREKHHLTFGPDPATHDRCTLGGMIGNNSCGVHSVMAGKTDDNIEALEILTYDGLRIEGRAKPATRNWSRSSATAAGGERSTPA